MIILMPDCGTSAYLNLQTAGSPVFGYEFGVQHYETFLMHDLKEHVINTFHVRQGRWAIGGHSMGGYGAMRLGCKYPDRFASIWAHSGAFHFRSPTPPQPDQPDDTELSTLLDGLRHAKDPPRISFDCGVDDFLYSQSLRLHANLLARGIEHHYAENPGGHTWDYWDRHLPEALAQHQRVFNEE